MTEDEFWQIGKMELSRQDTLAMIDAFQGGDNMIAKGIKELQRWAKAQEAFPGMSLLEMWETDRALGETKEGRPELSDLKKIMCDPAWAAVADIERLKSLWRELMPGKQIPLEMLTDISTEYRDANREAVVARRNRPKTRRVNYP